MEQFQLEYAQYLESPEWQALKDTHPDPKQCIFCETWLRPHLHHMRYPANIWDTRHEDCCWLCEPHHEMFHRGLEAGRRKGYALTCAWDGALKDFTKAVIRAQEKSERDSNGFEVLRGMTGEQLATWLKGESSPRARKRA